MNILFYAKKISIFIGMIAMLVLSGKMQIEIPGSNGVTSNFAEVALVICIPFFSRWYFATFLAVFTVLNVTPEGSLFGESYNHVIGVTALWFAFEYSKKITSVTRFILFWILGIAVYYFIFLIPLIFLYHFVMGSMTLLEAYNSILLVSSAAIYEYVVTTFVAVFYFTMHRELGQRKLSQLELLRKNQELYKQTSLLQAQYDATQEGILVVSAEGKMLNWNKRFIEIWQIPEEIMRSRDDDAAARYSLKLLASPDEFIQKVEYLYANPDFSQTDTIELNDGRTLVRFTGPVRSDSGENLGRIWFFREVSDLIKAQKEKSVLQEQLHQSQKMEAVGQLAGGVAHDFNNSLGAIMGAAELLLISDFSKEEQQEFIEMILIAGERASDLTKKLLLFSRKENKVSTAVDCFKIATDTAALLKHTINKNIVVSVENRSAVSSIIGDDSLLQNALMNMGINASHAMPNGGELTFSLENLTLDEEYCSLSAFEIDPGEYLEIAIRDTGTGMPPEVQSRIFEPFFTTKEAGKGTGLGMAAVYGTVQEHGGAITVYSEVGVGTVFRIYLPVSSESAVSTDQTVALSRGTGTILVVDDEELIRITARALLENLGYTVILATNGLEGVNTFAETKEEIDLIILDMIMPVMGGREVFSKLREIDPTIPVIIASGFAKEEDMTALKQEGVNGFLNKPFRRADLAEMVAGAINVA